MYKQARFQQELLKCLTSGALDVTCIQEYHLSQKRINKYGSLLHGRWEMFWSQAYGQNEVQGVCIITVGKWSLCIIAKEVIVPGRAQLLVEVQNKRWSVLNILYVPNNTHQRKEFWLEILQKLQNVISVEVLCLMAGDF
jgi:exonuclease III